MSSERRKPEPPRVPMIDVKPHTVIGICIHGAEIVLKDIDEYWRAALERGHEAMKGDVL